MEYKSFMEKMKVKLDDLDDFSKKSVAKQKLAHLMHTGKAPGALIANKMRTLNMGDDIDQEDLDALHEVLSKDAKAGDWISDFVHSDNPKFAGKSKKERIKMALGAYYGKQNEAYQSYSGRSHGHAYGGGGFGRREREDDEYHVPDPTPVAPAPAKKYIKGTPENKALKASQKPINGHPTNEETEQDHHYQVTYYDKGGKAGDSSKRFADKDKADAHALKGNSIDKVGGTYKVHKVGTPITEGRNEDDVPFDKPYKTINSPTVKDKSGAVHTPMSRARDLARKAMNNMKPKAPKPMAEANDPHEYADGEMSIHELKQIKAHVEWILEMLKPETDMPEWVQAKITLAADYLSTACDYLHVELNEELKGGQKKLDKNHNNKLDAQDFAILRAKKLKEASYSGLEKESKPKAAPTAMVKTSKTAVAGDTVEGWHKPTKAVKEELQKVDVPAYLRKQKGEKPLELKDLKRKDTISDPENLAKARGVKEGKLTYKEFAMMLEYEANKNGSYVHQGTYGSDYAKAEREKDEKGFDDESKETSGKRGPKMGSKRGPRANLGNSKLHTK